MQIINHDFNALSEQTVVHQGDFSVQIFMELLIV